MVSQGLKPGLHPTSPSKQKTPQIAPYLNAFEARLRRASQIVLVLVLLLVLAFPLPPSKIEIASNRARYRARPRSLIVGHSKIVLVLALASASFPCDPQRSKSPPIVRVLVFAGEGVGKIDSEHD
jgi:hypothetical protein